MRHTYPLMLIAVAAACSEASAPAIPPPPIDKAPTDPTPLPTIDAPCVEELVTFERDVWIPVLTTQCFGCHNAEGTAKTSRMHFVDRAVDDALEKNFIAAGTLGAVDIGSLPLLLAKPSGQHPDGHTGGMLLPVGSRGYEALARFVVAAKDPACNAEPATGPDCTTPTPSRRLLRRLTHHEYDRTVTALFGVPSERATTLAQDPEVDGYDNHASTLQMTPLLADQYRVHAEDIAAAAIEDLPAILGCDPALGVACAQTFIERFGARAFRRPLLAEETARYITLFEAAQIDGFEQGIRWVITAMLQSANFVYRPEVGTANAQGVFELSGYEIASELSYLITGGPPDDELIRIADAGLLRAAATRRAEALRLLATPDARAAITRFFLQWLEIDRVRTVPKDGMAFPEVDTALRDALLRETSTFVTHAMWSGTGKLPELLNGGYTFVNPQLERFYETIGAGTPIDGFKIVRDPAIMHGLLSQGSLLTVHARANSSSPVHRGVLIRERFLCQSLPPPPPGLNAEPPPLDPGLTGRQRYAAHSEVEPCRSCHRLIDPIGFAFEHYDGVGRYRNAEGGAAIDTSGAIVDSLHTDATFDGLGELAGLLAASEEVHNCFAQQWLRYGYGLRAEQDDLVCTLDDVRSKFIASELDIVELLLALVEAPHFVVRSGDTTAVPDPGPEPPPTGEGIDVEIIVDSDWTAGYCHTAVVSNTSVMPIDWVVQLDIDGTLVTQWNATAIGTGGRVTFEGVDHNNVVEAGASTSFGYCGER